MTNTRADASRLNGSKSKGPTTEEGKKKVSMNALKTGLFSKQRFLAGENPEEFDALVEGLVETYRPETLTEYLIIEQIAQVLWRHRRLVVAEAAQTEIERNRYRYSSDMMKYDAFGGIEFAVGVNKQPPNTIPAEIRGSMDQLVEAARSLPVHAERFFQLDASLSRELQRLIKQLREEQALREGAPERSMPPAA